MKIILFRGRPGTGKTHFSQLISTRLQIPVFRKDDIYDHLSLLSENHDLKNKACFDILYSLLISNSKVGSSIIIDFPFQFEDDISRLESFCDDVKIDQKTILVICTDEVLWRDRFNKRKKHPKPNQLITDFDELKKRYHPLHLQERKGELMIDSKNDSTQNLNKIISFISFNA